MQMRFGRYHVSAFFHTYTNTIYTYIGGEGMEPRKRALYIVCISEETSNIGNAFLPPPADGQYSRLGVLADIAIDW